ncbi:MAG: type II toxin-antitoxin system VapC family toxin [Candidatus Acidiferrales bacterium]
MGLDQLDSFLRPHRRIALDTPIFIYQLESNPRYVAFTDRIFAWIERSDHRATTSTITMVELLVQPYRALDQSRVDDFYTLLSTVPKLEWVAPDLKIADLAARIRALHRLRTPDALQAATALQSEATALITNDSTFERVQGIETLVLDRFM